MTAPICGDHSLYLRAATPGDAAALVRWKSDPVVRRMALGKGYEATIEGEADEVRRAVEAEREDYLIIVLRDGERPIGYVRLNWMDAGRKEAWLRFALGERRREGHGRAALRCLLDHLFAAGLHRVDAETYDYNEASRRVLRSLGFVEEGRRRQAQWDGESWRDVLVLGLLEGEFGDSIPDPDSQTDPAS